VFEPVFAVGPG